MNDQSLALDKRRLVAKLSGARKSLADYLTQPAVRLLAKTSIAPNALSWFGFLVTVGAAGLIMTGYLFAAGLVVLFAGFFDILDGALARSTNQITRFGGVLDSTLDRLSEAVLFLSLLPLYAGEPPIGVLAVALALVGSLMVSYVKARAESLGIECQVGLFTRAERVVVLALGLLLNQVFLALVVIAVLSFITFGQRLFQAWRETKK